MTALRHGTLPALALHGPAFAAIAALLPAVATAQSQPRIEVDMSLFAARNPFLLPEDDTVTPGGQLAVKAGAEWRLDFRTKLETEGAVAYRQYARRYGHFVTGRADVALVHRRNEYLSLRSAASFERVLPIEALASSVDSAIDPVSIQVRHDLSQAATVHTSARTAFTGHLGWSRIDPRGSTLLAPTSAVSAELAAETRIDSVTTLGAVAQVTRSRSATGGDPHAWSILGKAARRLPRAWNAAVELGATRVSRRGTGSRRETGPVQFSGRASLCQEPGRVRFCASAAVASVVGSFGGIQRETSAAMSFDWRSSARGTLAARGSYVRVPRSTGLQGFEVPGLELLNLIARYEHRLDERFVLYGGAEYRRRVGIGDTPLDSVTLQTGLLYRIPRP